MRIYGGWEEIFPYDAPERADKILAECDDICRKLGFGGLWFLMGTCLGIVRDGGYIQDDNDLDIGPKCSEEELEKFIEELIKNGYIRDGVSRHFYKYGILVDLRPMYNESPFEVSFTEIVYKGRAYRIPKLIDEYLRNYYGDWRVKKPKNPTNDYSQKDK